MSRIFIDDNWGFTNKYEDEILKDGFDISKLETVRLPHTCKELPYHYFDEHEYQMVSGYVRNIEADNEWEGKTVLLTIDGAAHESTVYLNGKEVGKHSCGYTAFTIDISKELNYGTANRLVIKVDSNENLNIPPFGFVIDYMTYGGIYRDVYLDIKNKSYIEDIFVTTKIATPDYDNKSKADISPKSAICSKYTLVNAKAGQRLVQSFRKKGEKEYKDLGEFVISDAESVIDTAYQSGKVMLWDTENPALYEVKTELIEDGSVIDEKVVTFGFRKAIFKKDGFYLNGRKFKIRGLNRHQSYPYVGYAMPKSMQVHDADILKNELGLNAVRTSHYPQSHYFLDRCDEIGLLVFTEFPGWQHIGDEAWKNQAVENVKDMILQYRNHTSIILWGVRINESVDDDEFYERTNKVAHELDPSRPTGGVRCYKKGSLLEDVFTYNDFSHDGKHKGCEPKSDVTSDEEKPYLISEYNGHMYPTKPFDWEEKRLEHALRHANVLDEVMNQEDIAGSFGWGMFDYNTHKDFGSGDRICYHGVMDMFRNPKLASAVYASQQDETPVLTLSTSMDIGEHPGGNLNDIYIFTNADSVKMYKNDKFIKEYTKKDSPYKNLEHPPIRIDDYIGSTLEEETGMPHKQAEDVKSLLNATAKVGLYGLTKAMYLKAGKLMLMYHMKMEEAVELYNKYIGNWGGESTVYRFEAIKNDEVVKVVEKKPMTGISFKVSVDHTELKEDYTYDVAAVRIEAVDEFGNVLPYFNDVVNFEIKGDADIIGPKTVAFSGGMGGTYIKTLGKAGKAKLKIKSPQAETVDIDFTINI